MKKVFLKISQISQESTCNEVFIINLQAFKNTYFEENLQIVTSIFRKGAKDNAGNYRPIILTFILCNLMKTFTKESVMALHMT